MKKLLIALMFASTTSHAAFYSGNELLTKMDSTNPSERSLALGYIAGVVDILGDVSICPKQGVNLGQAQDIVRKKLIAVPESRHLSADWYVFAALSEAFPCPKKKGV